MRWGRSIRFRAALRSGAAVGASLTGAGWLHAQGCAMCYNDAAAARSATIQALRSGILILLVPVLALFVGIFLLAFRKRNRFHEAEDGGPADEPCLVPGGALTWDEPCEADEAEAAVAGRYPT